MPSALSVVWNSKTDLARAPVKLLKRDGIDALTTNRISDVAGVCVGSIYQYFPDKRAIYAALHGRHIAETQQLIERTLSAHDGAALPTILLSLMDALVDDHAREPELHALLDREIPRRPDGVAGLPDALRELIAARAQRVELRRDLDRTLFIVPHMMNALAHEAVLSRPSQWSITAAKNEAAEAILTYVRAAPPDPQ